MRNLFMLGLFVFIFALTTEKSAAQLCCSTGSTSTSTFEVGVTPAKSLRMSLGHEYNDLGGAYDGTNRIDDPLGREGSVQAYSLKAHYGISSRWGVSLSVPYMLRSRSFGNGGSFSASGLGDVSLLFKYSLLQLNIASRNELAFGGGIKAPTGATDLTDNGTPLFYDLQPGTGEWDALFWIYVYRTWLPSPWSGSVSAVVRLPGTFDGLSLGNEILYSLVVNRRLADTAQLVFRLRGRTAGLDTREGYMIPGTGGTVVFAAPAFGWSPLTYLSFEAGVDIPVFFSVTGTQQALNYRSFLDMSFYFNSAGSLEVN